MQTIDIEGDGLARPIIPSLENVHVNIHAKDETYLSSHFEIARRYTARDPDTAQSNNFQASFTLLKCFIGAGILTLPYSFHSVGIIPAIFGLLFIAILTYYCMYLLMRVADDKKGSRLEILAFEVLGRWGMYSVEISVSLHQFGTSTATLIFATKFLNYLVCNLGFAKFCNNTYFEAIACLMVVIPLSMINNIHYFYIPSICSSMLALTGITTQLSYDIDLIQQDTAIQASVGSKLLEFDLTTFPMFLGIAIYMFEGVGTFFNIRAAMATPKDFTILLRYQMTIVVLLYLFFASISDIAMGDNIQNIVLFSLPVKGIYIWVVGLYAVAVLLGYPLRLFPLLRILENSTYLKQRIFDMRLRTKNRLLRYGLRIVLIFCMLFITFLAKSLNTFLSFVGSFISSYLAFILPILMYNEHFAKTISRRHRNFNRLALGIGITVGVLGVIVSVSDMLGLNKQAT